LLACHECEVCEQFENVGVTIALITPTFIPFINSFHVSLADQCLVHYMCMCVHRIEHGISV